MNFAVLDTSSYLRLGRCLHPILGQQFGPPPWVAKILGEVQREFEAKPNLANAFPWFTGQPFDANRQAHVIPWNMLDLGSVRAWQSNILSWARMNARLFREQNCSVPSPTDCLFAAYAAAAKEAGAETAVVTDDAGLRLVVQELETGTPLHGYEMLSHYVTAGFVNAQQANALYQELNYMRELPRIWRSACQATFGFPPP